MGRKVCLRLFCSSNCQKRIEEPRGGSEPVSNHGGASDVHVTMNNACFLDFQSMIAPATGSQGPQASFGEPRLSVPDYSRKHDPLLSALLGRDSRQRHANGFHAYQIDHLLRLALLRRLPGRGGRVRCGQLGNV